MRGKRAASVGSSSRVARSVTRAIFLCRHPRESADPGPPPRLLPRIPPLERFPVRWHVAGICEVVGAFVGLAGSDHRSKSVVESVDGSGCDLAEVGFEL